MKLEKRFPERRVIITGAGSGLGRTLALQFAQRGWRVAVTDINNERIKESADMVKEAGGTPLTAVCDVTEPADFGKLTEKLSSEWGGVDILINNAGVVAGGYMEKMPVRDWEWILDVNVKSVIHGCAGFIPLFKKQGSGYIVNIASNAGITCLPEMSSYNVTKAAVISLSETLKTELSPFNIGVTVSCPTFFKTNLMDQLRATDERQRKLAECMFNKSKVGAEKVARNIIRAVERRRLYEITQFDGNMTWRLKRLCPETFYNVLAWGYRNGLFEKYTGINRMEG